MKHTLNEFKEQQGRALKIIAKLKNFLKTG